MAGPRAPVPSKARESEGKRGEKVEENKFILLERIGRKERVRSAQEESTFVKILRFF
jgi:hypothetical protein